MNEKQMYLGDGAYAEITEFNDIKIYTSNGISVTNEIYLEASSLVDLMDLR